MDEELKRYGFNPDKLTEAQKDIIMQPSYAPENYHHDGEVTPKEALRIWRQSLKRAGLSEAEIARAMYMHSL